MDSANSFAKFLVMYHIVHEKDVRFSVVARYISDNGSSESEFDFDWLGLVT